MSYKASRIERNALFHAREYVMEVVEIIRNVRSLKWRVTQTLADYSRARKPCASDRLFQGPGYDFSVLCYSSPSGEGLLGKRV